MTLLLIKIKTNNKPTVVFHIAVFLFIKYDDQKLPYWGIGESQRIYNGKNELL